MANLTKLEFVAHNVSSKNYLSWVLDAEIHLDAMGFGDTIKDKYKASKQDCAKAMIFLRHHLDEILKIEYLTIKDPLISWNNLKERITSQLKLYGDTISDSDIFGKAFSTFHVSNVLLQKGCGCTHGRGRGHGRGQNSSLGANYSSKKKHHQKGNKKKDEKCEVAETKSLKKKEKNPEANFISEDQVDITHLDVANFFEHLEGKIDHLIGDGSIVKDD
ncbi:uncharacterized protein LOC132054173 [Lycium ferocissimum]|uniref:uncharacterized protein LOC132054173 n=1 Tax=Lycium ferocissimum TaxID=112874 RepID=UPI002815305E|nr:uncharacterized protein LOC132054173 [Lycium ferocissimum]